MPELDEVEAYIQRVVDAAPTLTTEQIQKLSSLFNGQTVR